MLNTMIRASSCRISGAEPQEEGIWKIMFTELQNSLRSCTDFASMQMDVKFYILCKWLSAQVDLWKSGYLNIDREMLIRRVMDLESVGILSDVQDIFQSLKYFKFHNDDKQCSNADEMVSSGYHGENCIFPDMDWLRQIMEKWGFYSELSLEIDWRISFSLLLEFGRVNGHYSVPSGTKYLLTSRDLIEMNRNKVVYDLGDWVKRQRILIEEDLLGENEKRLLVNLASFGNICDGSLGDRNSQNTRCNVPFDSSGALVEFSDLPKPENGFGTSCDPRSSPWISDNGNCQSHLSAFNFPLPQPLTNPYAFAYADKKRTLEDVSEEPWPSVHGAQGSRVQAREPVRGPGRPKRGRYGADQSSETLPRRFESVLVRQMNSFPQRGFGPFAMQSLPAISTSCPPPAPLPLLFPLNVTNALPKHEPYVEKAINPQAKLSQIAPSTLNYRAASSGETSGPSLGLADYPDTGSEIEADDKEWQTMFGHLAEYVKDHKDSSHRIAISFTKMLADGRPILLGEWFARQCSLQARRLLSDHRAFQISQLLYQQSLKRPSISKHSVKPQLVRNGNVSGCSEDSVVDRMDATGPSGEGIGAPETASSDSDVSELRTESENGDDCADADYDWSSRFRSLLDYKDLHGHCNVPSQYLVVIPGGAEFDLGRWLRTQLTFLLKKRGHLSKEKVLLLTGVLGSEPQQLLTTPELASINPVVNDEKTVTASAKKRPEKALSRKALGVIESATDGTDMSGRKSTGDKAGGSEGREGEDKSPGEKSSAVESAAIPIVFYPDGAEMKAMRCMWASGRMDDWEEKWNTRFDILNLFANKFGHCNVPLKVEAVLANEQRIKLGLWLSNQRQRKKRLELRADRVEKMQRLVDEGKMYWNSETAKVGPSYIKWDCMYDELIRYAETHDGSCNVPRNHQTATEDPQSALPLGDWLEKQRRLYRKDMLRADRREAFFKLISEGKLTVGDDGRSSKQDKDVSADQHASSSVHASDEQDSIP